MSASTKTKQRSVAKSKKTEQLQLAVQRGSIVKLKKPVSDSRLAIVVSNEVQNDIDNCVSVVPLVRSVSRLKAPFAVDLGRKEGMRELHSARCDRVHTTPYSNIKTIERATVTKKVVQRLDKALAVSLGISKFSDHDSA